MPQITVKLPDGTTTNHELTDDLITVGRLSDNVIQIDDASVSSYHAEFVVADGGFVLRDLDSTNGTRLNGKMHKEGRLQDGDKIMFGKVVCAFTSENPADARPMPEEGAVDMQPAEASIPPANFSNASPFQTKKKKSDPTGMAIIAFAVVAILAFVGAVISVFSLTPPSL